MDLENCLLQVEASKAWFKQRVLPLSIDQLRWRPSPHTWSIGECLDHLNVTLALYLRKLDHAIQGNFRQSPSETDALILVEPPVTVPATAPAATLPRAGIDPECLIDQFRIYRNRYADAVRQAIGVDFARIQVGEPIHPGIVSLGGILVFLAAHDRRHMWQAERVRQNPRFPKGCVHD